MNKKLYPLLFFIAFAANAIAQNNSLLNRNISALENYALAKPIEKVHLHVDRQLYFPGDTIWFKAYVVLGEYHKLSALSSILYVELIDPKDSVIKRLTLGLQDGTAPGDFELPFNMAPGSYRIRAYTAWMRNFGSEYFFDWSLTVAGFSNGGMPPPGAAVKIPEAHVPDKVDLQFFPEGGDLVNGLRSKVAFKAIDQHGMAEDVQGSIMDNTGNEVATFTSQHLGMGALPLEPQKGKQYVAKVTAADGSVFTVPLPAAKDAGFTLSVNNNLGDSLYVKVAAANVPDSAFYLIAQSDGKSYFAAAGRLADKVFTASIPKSRFPTGIIQFTLFSQSGEPLNERVVFIQNDDQLKLTITPDKQSYAPGEKVKLTLQATEPDGTPATGAFSVAVVDESKVPVNEQAENTIFTDLLLKSEISGYIQNPNYYFIDPNEKTKAGLDLLMLTQGYRRFEWKKILSDSETIFSYKPEKGFTMSGSVKTPAGKPVAKGEVILTSVRNHLLMDTLTDDNGRFSFENIGLTDSATIIINSKKANGGGNVKTLLDKPVYPMVDETSQAGDQRANQPIEQFPLTTSQIRFAYTAWRQDSLTHVIQLKEVKVKGHKIPPFHPDYAKLLKYSANLNGPGNANQVYLPGDELLAYGSLPAALQGKLENVTISGSAAISNRAVNRHLSGQLKPMALYVDGTPVPPDYLSYISPSEVYSIEVLTSAMYYAIYGSNATGGALIITLKNGAEMMREIEPVPGLLNCKFYGFYKAREFYLPKYEKETAQSSDSRKTTYWNPNVRADDSGNSFIEYCNPASKGFFRITIEGIVNEGKFGRLVFRYLVK